jgi:uncharacterized membrane protein YdjX (TVP38/TMEM64 family)
MIGKGKGPLIHDLIIIAISITGAVFLARSGLLEHILVSTGDLRFLGMFIAGVFFTSIFTTPPAIAALGAISLSNNPIEVAVFGALGAVVGDLIIFHFIRDNFAEHLKEVIGPRKLTARARALIHVRLFRIISFFLGALVIASPLPDELGVGLLGFSKMKTLWFVPVSFVCNAIGILLIAGVARAL